MTTIWEPWPRTPASSAVLVDQAFDFPQGKRELGLALGHELEYWDWSSSLKIGEFIIQVATDDMIFQQLQSNVIRKATWCGLRLTTILQ